MITLFPTGSFHGENVARFQPAKMAGMEGLFETQEGAGMAIVGMPDTERRELMDPSVAGQSELPHLSTGSGAGKYGRCITIFVSF